MAYADSDVLDYYSKLKARLMPGRIEVIRGVYESILMYLGYQWSTYDPLLKNFRHVNVANPKVPRPVTNMFAAKLARVIAMLSSIEPALSFAPGSDSEEDRLTANAAKPILNFLERDVKLDTALRLELAYTVAVCNNAWLWVDFDPEGGSVKRFPRWVCMADPSHVYKMEEVDPTSPLCPVDKSPLMPSPKQYDEVSTGCVTAEVLTALDMWCDYTLRADEQPGVFRRRMHPLEWYKERYHGVEPQEVQAGTTADLGLTFKQNIIRLAPALGGFLGGARFTNQSICDDMQVLPCKEFPKGLLARIGWESEVLEAKPLPYTEGSIDNPGRALLTPTHFGYHTIPASPMLCTGPADFLKSPQRERNKLQAHMMMYASHSANNVWWMPEGVDVAQLHGIEGLVLTGNTTATGGGEPKRIGSGTIPNFFKTRMEEIDQEMDKIISIESLHDQAPRVDNARAIALLQQERQQSLNPVFRKWGESYAEVGRKLFHVFRSFAPPEMYTRIRGENAQWSTKKVTEADLRGGIDIVVEQGSLYPKTEVQKQAVIESMIEAQLVDFSDPVQRLKVTNAMGAGWLVKDMEVDEEHIAREHEAVKEWAAQNFDPNTDGPKQGVDPKGLSMQTFPVLIDPDLDLHPLHVARHRVWMLSEEFQSLPPAVQQMFRFAHYKAHVMAMMQQQAQQQLVTQEAAAQQGGANPQQKQQGGSAPQKSRQAA